MNGTRHGTEGVKGDIIENMQSFQPLTNHHDLRDYPTIAAGQTHSTGTWYTVHGYTVHGEDIHMSV